MLDVLFVFGLGHELLDSYFTGITPRFNGLDVVEEKLGLFFGHC
jgi:hypothetical protein